MPAQPNKSIILGFTILQEVISSEYPIGSREISRRLKLEHSRVNRILGTLVSTGMLQQNSKSKYYTGSRVHVLSALSLHASGIISHSLPILEPIHALGAQVALGTVWRESVVYLFNAYPNQDLAHSVGVHKSYPKDKSVITSVLGLDRPMTAYIDRPATKERAWGARIGPNGTMAIAAVLPQIHLQATPVDIMMKIMDKAANDIYKTLNRFD
jgi:DNA-binding IclR family transcriptional regulator